MINTDLASDKQTGKMRNESFPIIHDHLGSKLLYPLKMNLCLDPLNLQNSIKELELLITHFLPEEPQTMIFA